jgi:hypothetical protein
LHFFQTHTRSDICNGSITIFDLLARHGHAHQLRRAIRALLKSGMGDTATAEVDCYLARGQGIKVRSSLDVRTTQSLGGNDSGAWCPVWYITLTQNHVKLLASRRRHESKEVIQISLIEEDEQVSLHWVRASITAKCVDRSWRFSLNSR